jgi:hypothetical protein
VIGDGYHLGVRRPARPVLILVAALGLASACGRSYLDVAADTGAAAAGAGGGGGAGGTGGTGGTGQIVGACTVGADQTCNDDPTINALWGTCVPPGVCQCHGGVSLNPATGRCGVGPAGPCASPTICNDDPTSPITAGICQPDPVVGYTCTCIDGYSINPCGSKCRKGTACEAAAADPWFSTQVPLDASDCAMRPDLPCPMLDSPEVVAAAAVGSALPKTCAYPQYTELRVVLTNGCPVLVNPGPGIEGATLHCVLLGLAKARWSCLGASACALIESGGP